MPNVVFPEASYRLTPEVKQTVSIIAETLRSFPALWVRIAGHMNSTDDASGRR